jgi:hypothetical protein
MKIQSILISAAITAAILGVVGGVVRASSTAGETKKVQQLEQMIDAREQVYTQAIADANTKVDQAITEANSRIETANKMIKEVEQQKKQAEEQLAAIPTPIAGGVSQADALNVALQSIGMLPEGTSASVELIQYDGKPAYEIKLGDGSSLYVDAVSGAVVYNSLVGGPGKVITPDQAAELAKTYFPYGTVVKVERQDYNGQPAYKVTFYDGSEAYVSLGGQVLEVTQVQVSGYSGGGSSGGSSGGSGGGSGSSHREPEGEHESESNDD